MGNTELTLPLASLVLIGSGTVMSDDITDEMRRAASDLVSFNLTKAYALLAAITGEQHEAFAALNDEVQGNYLRALNDLIQDAHRAQEIEVSCQVRDAMRP